MEARRQELAIASARDGYALVEAVCHPSSPPWLRELPAVDVPRRVLVQNYTRTIIADRQEVITRRESKPDGDGLPPRHGRLHQSMPATQPSVFMLGVPHSMLN